MNYMKNLYGKLMVTIREKTVFLLLLAMSMNAVAGDIVPAPKSDPHYSKAGFFDIHVCNWPNRSLFFLALFSSYQYKDIAKIELFTPQGNNFGELSFDKFRLIQDKGKPDKKAFIKHFEIPENSGDGWYSARVTMNDGSRYAAEDYVVLRELERAKNALPNDGAEDVALPEKLLWDKVPGAAYYQVFINDNWEGKLIHQSKMLPAPEYALPKNLLAAGGFYSWRIHARDVNGNVLLGDFNHGSLTKPMTFAVASE